MNLEARLRRLEQITGGAGRVIVVSRDESETAEEVLRAENVAANDKDLIISVLRFFDSQPWPQHIKRVAIHERAA